MTRESSINEEFLRGQRAANLCVCSHWLPLCVDDDGCVHPLRTVNRCETPLTRKRNPRLASSQTLTLWRLMRCSVASTSDCRRSGEMNENNTQKTTPS